MTDYIFDLSVERTNPVVYRRVSVPGEYTLEDLINAVFISIGMDPGHGDIYINGEKQELYKNKTISESISESDDILIKTLTM